VNRSNLLVKVPGTKEGLSAIQQLIGEGINVNVTLLFGLPRYREVAEAYLKGLETLAASGRPLNRISSVASFFLSRIDVLIDPMVEKLRLEEGPFADIVAGSTGQVAIASAKVAYQLYQEIFGSERFKKLAKQGARPQRLLWASTSTKNPEYSDLKYVEALIGRDTVNTIPMGTLDAFRDHGTAKQSLEDDLAEDLAVIGIAQGSQEFARFDLALDQIVLSALVHGLHGQRFASCAGEYDNRPARRGSVRLPQGIQPVRSGRLQVNHDHVNRISRKKPLGLAHAIDVKQRNCVRRLTVEHLLNQTRICWILFDQKDRFARSLAHAVSLWATALAAASGNSRCHSPHSRRRTRFQCRKRLC